MSNRRFYCEGLGENQEVELGSEEARHLSRVLRAKPGDSIELFDGKGHEATARVEELGRSSVRCRVGTITRRTGTGSVHVTANVALPRGGAADDVVRHLVECGISAFRELTATRSVRRVKHRSESEQRERFKRLAVSSMKQCGLNIMPELLSASAVADLTIPRGSIGVFGSTARSGVPTLCEMAANWVHSPESIEFAIGPEGGWSEEEEASLRTAGFQAVSVGPTILRIETAAVAMATFLAALR